jgi:hypothetical protein
VRAADRLGQPVPAGTPVSFISEGGQIAASCTLASDVNGLTSCSVTLSSQAFRPADGRITLLAYMDGDEIFVDTNGNNRFDSGETFYDMGQPFLDANEDGVYTAATEQKVGDPTVAGSGIGSAACAPHAYLIDNVPNTCDATWGPTRVRAEYRVVLSGSFAKTTGVFGVPGATSVDVLLRDVNDNPMPFGTTVTASVSGGTNCSIVETIPATVPSTTSPTTHRVVYTRGSDAGDTCSGAVITVKATTPKGNQTLLGSVTVP